MSLELCLLVRVLLVLILNDCWPILYRSWAQCGGSKIVVIQVAGGYVRGSYSVLSCSVGRNWHAAYGSTNYAIPTNDYLCAKIITRVDCVYCQDLSGRGRCQPRPKIKLIRSGLCLSTSSGARKRMRNCPPPSLQAASEELTSQAQDSMHWLKNWQGGRRKGQRR